MPKNIRSSKALSQCREALSCFMDNNIAEEGRKPNVLVVLYGSYGMTL
jgi:hypothetical protein